MRKIKITDYIDDNELTFEVKDSFTEDIAWNCGDFWGWESDKEDYDDIVGEYLKKIAELVFNYMDKCYSVNSVIEFVGDQEGYIALDGNIGVKLVDVELYVSECDHGMEIEDVD